MKILAIESSCDETAAAIVEDGRKIISSVVASSSLMHQKYGGIVPEIAARRQLESIIPVLEEALNKTASTSNYELRTMNSIDAIAVTIGPGLIGSLLVGIETAKTLAFTLNKPVISVNHVLAHMYANFVEISDKKQVTSKNYSSNSALPNEKFTKNSSHPDINRDSNNNIQFPAISLVVSGGHTELYLMNSESKLKWLGGTIDDAAGECFDKGARILGFGSGGGLAIQQSAEKYSIKYHVSGIKLPRPMMYDKTLNFSFSGLKTALMREVNKHLSSHSLEKGNPRILDLVEDDTIINQLSFELQEAITDVLVFKTMNAVEKYQAQSILISGGVASNLRLREKFNHVIARMSASWRNDEAIFPIQFFAPPPSLCTDNACFIASYAYFCGKPMDWRKITAIPDLSVEV